MARYIVRRLLWSVLLLVLVSAVVFILFYVFPSADPAQLRAGRQANQDQIQAIRETLGLDKSVLTQFCRTHDIDNLYVMDGSAFVSIACQNPTLTIMALAVRSTDHLLDEMKKGNV